MTVVAYVPDLMDRSKVAAAAPAAAFVAAASQLVGAAGPGDVVVVDLSRPGVLDVLAAVVAGGARVVGFGSHVDRPLLEAARAAGCGEVLPRSAFFARLGQLLG
ncbi:MAG TPA: hypothetical protein VGI06_17440 [Acidimicrobiales bacterium]|jgi:beta-phosphoglucomutase-like phosphatase (HAD superfamily)